MHPIQLGTETGEHLRDGLEIRSPGNRLELGGRLGDLGGSDGRGGPLELVGRAADRLAIALPVRCLQFR